MCFSFQFQTNKLSNKICETNNSLSEGAFTLAKMLFFDTQNNYWVLRENILHLSGNVMIYLVVRFKRNDFEYDTIGSYCSKYNNISNGKKPLYDQTGQKGDWALLQQRSIIRLSLDSPRTFQSQKWENTST